MGDINLLARIERLAKKIGNAITTSDKASKSKFGIVKIGNGLNVNSGVVSVAESGGASAVVLYQGSGAGSGSWVDNISLPDNYTDYKLIFFNYGSLESMRFGGNCIYPPTCALNQNAYMRAGSNNDIQIKFTELKKMSVMATSSVSDVTIIAIK